VRLQVSTERSKRKLRNRRNSLAGTLDATGCMIGQVAFVPSKTEVDSRRMARVGGRSVTPEIHPMRHTFDANSAPAERKTWQKPTSSPSVRVP
jgi:hypothetical protein